MTRSHGSIPAGLVSAVRVTGSQEVGDGPWLVLCLIGFPGGSGFQGWGPMASGLSILLGLSFSHF